MGLLEKKRDYKERAINYHAKEKELNKLREKAALKNPDEFYMKMAKAKVVDGKLKLLEEKKDPKERLVDQTKNIALIAHKKQVEENRAEKLNSQLHLISFPKANTHIHFVEDVQELAKPDSKESVKESEKPEAKINVPEVEEITQLTQQKKKAYKRLHEQIHKGKNYDKILNALTMQKHLMGKGKKRKIVDEQGNVTYKWFGERKK